MKDQQIIKAALDMFMKYGIRSVSMDDVCRQLGISKKTLYEHIPTKRKLIEAVLSLHIQEKVNMMESLMSMTEDALDIMVAVSQQILEQAKHVNPRVAYDLQKYYGSIYKNWNAEHTNLVYNHLKQNIMAGKVQGYYREEINAEIIARIYSSQVKILLDNDVFPNSQFKQADLVQQFFQYHFHGILSPKGISKFNKQKLLSTTL